MTNQYTAVNRTVNTTLTLRNWAIGFYIVEYEMRGTDRATYEERVISALADALVILGIPRCDRRELYRYRRFYLAYPQIVEALSPLLSPGSEIARTVSEQSFYAKDESDTPFSIVESVLPQLALSGRKLVESLSFSHFVELIEIEDPLKRVFYEIECIRGNWSVRTLVEYATASLDNRLFVSKYQLELPRKEELERFLQAKRREITGG